MFYVEMEREFMVSIESYLIVVVSDCWWLGIINVYRIGMLNWLLLVIIFIFFYKIVLYGVFGVN